MKPIIEPHEYDKIYMCYTGDNIHNKCGITHLTGISRDTIIKISGLIGQNLFIVPSVCNELEGNDINGYNFKHQSNT